MAPREFPFAFDPPYLRLARLFGVNPDSARRDGGRRRAPRARYGPWHVATPCRNVAHAEVSGPYRFHTTAGPARLSLADRGLTFASNGRRGVCIIFREPVRGLEPTGHLRHPNLTVTVADCEGLVRVLSDEAAHRRGAGPGGQPVSPTEGSLPVDDDAGRLVGVVAQPAVGEGAPRHHGQVLGAGPLQRRPDQVAPDAPPAPGLGDARVDQFEAVALDPVDQLGLPAVGPPDDEAALVGRVDDLGVVGRSGHREADYHSPQPGGLTVPVTVRGSTAVPSCAAW